MFSHRLGPDFIRPTMKPKILGLSPLRKVAKPKSRKTYANRTLQKLCLDICKKGMLKKKVKTVTLLKKDIVQHLGFHSPKSRPIFSSKRLKYFPKRISPPPLNTHTCRSDPYKKVFGENFSTSRFSV